MGVGGETTGGDVKLFKMEVHTKKNRMVLDVIAHAETAEQAKAHVQKKFTGAEIRYCVDLVITPTHFVLGNWQTD